MFRVFAGLFSVGVLGATALVWNLQGQEGKPPSTERQSSAQPTSTGGMTTSSQSKKPNPLPKNDSSNRRRTDRNLQASSQTKLPEPLESIESPPTRVLEATVVEGTPFGVGRIKIQIPIESSITREADQFGTIECPDNRIWQETFSQDHRPANIHQTEALVVRACFLVRGSQDLVVNVSVGDKTLASDVPLKVQRNEKLYHQLLGEWWGHYCANSWEGASPEMEPLRWYFIEMLARRLNLRLPLRSVATKQASDLEKQFERSVSLLFGLESVRLAMMDDVESPSQPSHEKPTNPLPPAVRVVQVPIPSSFPQTKIEPIANATPQECFYLRCGRIKNYLWIRHLIMDWGGSLNEVVSTPVTERGIRPRIERQLALDPELLMAEGIDEQITDFALIGGDIDFPEGAAVGVLFEGSPKNQLKELLTAQREANQNATRAQETLVRLENRDVSFLSTSDHRVRSFYVALDNYHLVTNSRYLATRFLQAIAGQGRLGELKEFQYARSQLEEHQNYAAFLFLSDPFFRNLTSPKYRIERSRRQHAIRDLQSLHLARLAARSEGHAADTIADLIHRGFLPADFGQRPDGSFPEKQGQGFVDSLRGARGTFLPIADVSVTKATPSEVDAYYRFARKYREEWPMMDPVSVAFSRKLTEDADREHVVLDVKISPYARNEYGFLSQYLSPARTQRIAMAEGELLGLSGRLRGSGKDVDVHVGIVDAPVKYRIEQGELKRLAEFETASFAKRQSYAAVTPEGKAGLQQLQEFLKSVQHRRLPTQRTNLVQKAPQVLGWIGLVANGPFSPVSYFQWRLELVGKLHKLSLIDEGRNQWATWSIIAENSNLRTDLLPQLRFESTPRPAQVFFQLRDVKQAQVMDYLRAYRFVTSRRLSALNARALDRFASRLNTEATEVRQALENALDAQLVCPLGGEYERKLGPLETQRWTSTAWDEPSLSQVDHVPESYAFQFLDWLRGLEIEFTLSPAALHSRMELEVRPHEPSLKLHEMQIERLPSRKNHQALRPAPIRPIRKVREFVSIPTAPGMQHIQMTNRSSEPFTYEVSRAGNNSWGGPHVLRPNRTHTYEVDYAIRVRYQENSQTQVRTIQPKSRMIFRVR